MATIDIVQNRRKIIVLILQICLLLLLLYRTHKLLSKSSLIQSCKGFSGIFEPIDYFSQSIKLTCQDRSCSLLLNELKQQIDRLQLEKNHLIDKIYKLQEKYQQRSIKMEEQLSPIASKKESFFNGFAQESEFNSYQPFFERIKLVPSYNSNLFHQSKILGNHQKKSAILLAFLTSFLKKKINIAVWEDCQSKNFKFQTFFNQKKPCAFIVLFKLTGSGRVMGFYSTGVFQISSSHLSEAFIFGLEEQGYFYPKCSNGKYNVSTRWLKNMLVLGNKQLELVNGYPTPAFYLRTEAKDKQYFHIPNPEALIGESIRSDGLVGAESMQIYLI